MARAHCTYRCGRGNDVGLVDTLERDAVDGVWTSDHEKARFELLQEDNALATEATRQQDQDGAWCDAGAECGSSCAFVVLDWLWDVYGRVESRLHNSTRASKHNQTGGVRIGSASRANSSTHKKRRVFISTRVRSSIWQKIKSSHCGCDNSKSSWSIQWGKKTCFNSSYSSVRVPRQMVPGVLCATTRYRLQHWLRCSLHIF